jgi:tRNA uridine 5-carbamoylmethylation protein Kti12
MKILILEGIPTSGKSTITNNIKERLVGLPVRIAAEAETHEPVMEQTKELHISFFRDLIKRLVDEKPQLIIFDRLYLTQASRAVVTMHEYSTVESLLSRYGTLTVFFAS